jgi:molybdopterin-containing oxidoreductase family membrane subunit
LVLSVHSVVSWDFAMSIVPGWHATIFAPYFVAGAIYSGVAMVVTLLVPLRKVFKVERYITVDHFENLSKLLLLTGMIVGYAYFIEYFIAWYSGSPYERASFWNRAFGDYWWATWTMLICSQAEHSSAVRAVAVRESRYVVRALRDHRGVAVVRV